MKMSLRRKAKIADFHVHLIRQEHIAKFKVAVHHALRVNVLHAVNELRQEVAYLRFRQDFPVLENVNQRLNAD